jgi:hypothetical protein
MSLGLLSTTLSIPRFTSIRTPNSELYLYPNKVNFNVNISQGGFTLTATFTRMDIMIGNFLWTIFYSTNFTSTGNMGNVNVSYPGIPLFDTDFRAFRSDLNIGVNFISGVAIQFVVPSATTNAKIVIGVFGVEVSTQN